MERIRDYKISSLLGEGGMGKVYLAEEETLGRKFAVKILDARFDADPDFIDRFMLEAKVMIKLDHPNIIKLHSYFYEDSKHCIVLEFVKGKTLRNLINEKGRLSWDDTNKIFSQILEGMGHAHQMGVVHRDIKPSNIMIDENGRVKIMDFGIARILDEKGMTRTGIKLGTLSYMSPEQVLGDKSIDQRTDIYSLGILLFEMLTGTVPFDKKADTDYKIMDAIVKGNLTYNHLKVAEVQENLPGIIRGMTAADKTMRPPTCLQVTKLLYDNNKNEHTTEETIKEEKTGKKAESYASYFRDEIKDKTDNELVLSYSEMVPVEGAKFKRLIKKFNGHDGQMITLSSFYISKYLVTQEEWELVMNFNPSHFLGEKNLPVECVTWYEAIDFCNRLSEKLHLKKVYSGSGINTRMNIDANGFRLPTETEWEYAARGGVSESGEPFSGSSHADEVAWYARNSERKTHPVGQKSPNKLGIYDMSGNVWEWCWDWFGTDISRNQVNPQGPVSGTSRILRGGGMSFGKYFISTSNRYSISPGSSYRVIGFRLARSKY